MAAIDTARPVGEMPNKLPVWVPFNTNRSARATVVQFTRRGRRLLAAVFDLVDQIEREFESALAPGEFEQLRNTPVRLADRIDPIGVFGARDASLRRPRVAR